MICKKNSMIFTNFVLIIQFLCIKKKSCDYNKNSFAKELKEYYECLDKRAIIIHKGFHRESIICELGQICILKSSYCKNPIPKFYDFKLIWKRITKKSFKINPEIIDTVLNKEFSIDSENSLTIFSIAEEEEGYYWEMIYNNTVLKEYHVTVLKNLVRRPLYESYSATPFNNNNNNNNTIKLLSDYAESFTLWNEWNSCTCTKNKIGIGSYRVRFGDCYLRYSQNVYNLKITQLFALKSIELLLHYKLPIPCHSVLLPKKLRDYIALKNLKNYIMYGDCIKDCGQNLSLINFDEYRKHEYVNSLKILNQNKFGLGQIEKLKVMNEKRLFFDDMMLAESDSTVVFTGQLIKLQCSIKKHRNNYEIFRQLNISWHLPNREISSLNGNFSYDNGRIMLNQLHELVIKGAIIKDSGQYVCFFDERLLKIIILRVINKLPLDIFKYTTLAGSFLIVGSLVLITLMIAFSKKKIETKIK